MQKGVRIVLALALGLVACELVLQGVAWGNRALHRRDPGSGDPGGAARVWVCVGDSNTYGVFEDAQDAYPGVLQRLLDEHAPGANVTVVNLGMPATNVREAAEALQGALERYEPELAIVLSGVNNSWSWRSDEDDAWEGPPWYERLRLVRLVRLLGRERSDDAVAPGGRAGTDDPERSYSADGRERRAEAELHDSIVRDLARLLDRVEPSACRPVLLTYPWDEGWLATANAAIRDVAAARGTLFVDSGARFAPIRDELADELLYYPDRHLRARGYQHFARGVLTGLVELGLVALETPLGEVAGAPLRAPAPTVEEAEDGGLPRLHIASNDPGRPFAVVLSAETAAEGTSAARLGGRTLAVWEDEVYRSTLLATALVGTTDAEGRATVDLAALASAAETLRGRRYLAAYVVYQGVDRPKVRQVSEAVRFEVR